MIDDTTPRGKGDPEKPTSKPMKNIYQRINAIRSQVAYIQKDKTVQTYRAVSHDMVVAVTRPYFVSEGVIVYPEQERGQMNAKERKTDSKTGAEVWDAMRLYEGAYMIHFVNQDDPADRITVKVEAHANDNGDKAPGKAVTYATKSAILKVLMLETGENDESRIPQEREPTEEEIAHQTAMANILAELQSAAMRGMPDLQNVFNALPNSAAKSQVWKEHSAILKGAANAASKS